jgi:hypothetical protein
LYSAHVVQRVLFASAAGRGGLAPLASKRKRWAMVAGATVLDLRAELGVCFSRVGGVKLKKCGVGGVDLVKVERSAAKQPPKLSRILV